MMAFEVLRTEVSHTEENMFYRDYRKRSRPGLHFYSKGGLADLD